VKLLMRDDTLPHQIRIISVGADIGVTCSCQPPRVVFKRAPILPADEALAVYRKHLADTVEVA